MSLPPFRPRILLGWIVAVLSFASACAADPAVDMWRANKATFENYANNMRPLPQHRMSEIMLLRPEGKYLVLRTPLNDLAAEQEMRVTIDGVHGIGAVSVRRDDRTTGLAEPLGFRLAFGDFPVPCKSTNINITLDPLSRQLALSNLVQITNGPIYQVIFTQQKPQTAGGQGYVQLIIIQTRTQGAAPDQVNLQSPDFFSFIREHPAETEQHLRPLFREFGQEAVFAPDTLIAWQVFNDLWKPDAGIGRQVDALLPGLKSYDYHARDAAQFRLQQLGRDGAAVLMHLDRSRLTPEQNARVDCALAPYALLPAKEAARLGNDTGFLLDCLYSDNVDLRAAAFNRLRGAGRPALQFDLNADAENRSHAIQGLREQLMPHRG